MVSFSYLRAIRPEARLFLFPELNEILRLAGITKLFITVCIGGTGLRLKAIPGHSSSKGPDRGNSDDFEGK
jgi:hypothetical protein